MDCAPRLFNFYWPERVEGGGGGKRGEGEGIGEGMTGRKRWRRKGYFFPGRIIAINYRGEHADNNLEVGDRWI